MPVKIYLIIFLLVTIATVTGCANKQNKDDNDNQIRQNKNAQTQNNQPPEWMENFKEATMDDLIIGQQILAMGIENSDGSVNVNQIMIGNDETDFGELGGNVQFRERKEVDTNMGNNTDRQPPAGFEGRRGNFEQMQNMSDEERAKMREQMTAGRGMAGRTMPNNMGGMAQLVGEIIDKDDGTITLKLKDGGSKLIFYSDKTIIRQIENNTENIN